MKWLQELEQSLEERLPAKLKGGTAEHVEGEEWQIEWAGEGVKNLNSAP